MRKSICATERQECIAFFQWATKIQKIDPRDIQHFANEGKRSLIEGANLKKMGLVKGLSDYFISLPSEHYFGLWVEMKVRDKKKACTPPEQVAFIERQIEKGYYGEICYGADEAISLVKRYLSSEKFN